MNAAGESIKIDDVNAGAGAGEGAGAGAGTDGVRTTGTVCLSPLASSSRVLPSVSVVLPKAAP